MAKIKEIEYTEEMINRLKAISKIVIVVPDQKNDNDKRRKNNQVCNDKKRHLMPKNYQ